MGGPRGPPKHYTERHAAVEQLLDDKKINVKPLFMTDAGWQSEAMKGLGDGALVLAADRLCDYRLLAALGRLKLNGYKAVTAVDLRPPHAAHEAERRYTVYDGKLIEPAALAPEEFARAGTGVYVFTHETLRHALAMDEERRREYARALTEAGEASTPITRTPSAATGTAIRPVPTPSSTTGPGAARLASST